MSFLAAPGPVCPDYQEVPLAQKTPSPSDDDPTEAHDAATDAPQDEVSNAVEDAEILEETPSDTAEADADHVSEVGEDAPSGEHVEAEPFEAATDADANTPPEPEKPNTFVPMVLGGVIAAVLGGAVVYFLQPSAPPMVAPDSALVERIEALEAAAVPQADTISADEQSAFDGLSGEIAGLSELIAAIDTRLTELAQNGVAVVGGEDGAAVTAELNQMRDALEDQRAATEAAQAEMTEAAAAARAEIEAAEARAAELQASAGAQATQAARQSAIARIVAASETGAPFAGALSDLSGLGADISGLEAVGETGIPSLPALQRSFPDIARDGLAASVKETMGEGVGDRIGAFLRAQVGARSLEAREGDDPDAVLSRAEAALRSGDIAGVLTELQTLPEGGLAAMAGWTMQAQTRIDALETLMTLTASSNE